MTGLFPERIVQYRCPACGKVMDGKTYDIDESLPKCKGKVHRMLALACEYARVAGSVKSAA